MSQSPDGAAGSTAGPAAALVSSSVTPCVSPCDLAALVQQPPTQPLELGGRVIYADARSWLLADALATVRVLLPEHAPGANSPLGAEQYGPGSLLRLEVKLTQQGWQALRIVAAEYAPEPRGDGEFARLASQRGQHLAARARALRAIREYFEQSAFIEVDTPTFVPCPGLDAHVDSLAPVQVSGVTYHLITSPEFHMKRLLSGGMPRIYQIARCFRAEELGRLHEPEFSLIEWYRAFAGWQETMHDTEQLVRAVFFAIASPELQALVAEPFERLSVEAAFAEFAGEDQALALADNEPARFFELLVDKVEPGIFARGKPVFLTHYPLSMAALARPCAERPGTAERYELYFAGMELCNGFGELTDAKLQRQRFESELAQRQLAGAPRYPIDEKFLAALDEGMPPSSGNALGLDRLVMLATGAAQMRDTYAFAHDER